MPEAVAAAELVGAALGGDEGGQVLMRLLHKAVWGAELAGELDRAQTPGRHLVGRDLVGHAGPEQASV